jgi:hypothetical protein
MALVDGVRGDQPVDDDRAGLAHPVCTGDRPCFGAGLELRFHEDDYRGALQVVPHAAELDLHHERRKPFCVLERLPDPWLALEPGVLTS